MKIILIFLSIWSWGSLIMAQHEFVTVNGTHFERKGERYVIVGTNFWYGMNLGVGKGQERLIRELDRLQELGINNLRIMGASEGPDDAPWQMVPSLQPEPGRYREELWEGLDFLLMEMGKRNMTAVVCLNNFWPWSGGMAQYHHWFGGGEIPYPPPAEGGTWLKYQLYTQRFYRNRAALKAFEAHVKKILLRINSLTGQAYTNDPTIMAWEIANEPRGILKKKAYRRFLHQTAGLIKSLDPQHLVTTGSEGKTSSSWAGNRFIKDHHSPFIDYATVHIWVQNWGWYDASSPAVSLETAICKAQDYLTQHVAWATQMGKPLILEEFGISRDFNSHDSHSATQYRDQFYQEMFQQVVEYVSEKSPLAGANFWAWAGEGRPRVPEAIWQPGDEFIGDPPHELQGWYSVYDTDSSTLEVIREFGQLMRGIE